jgi:enterochelin esterase-like enzyme
VNQRKRRCAACISIGILITIVVIMAHSLGRVASLPIPPEGFDRRRDLVEHGKVEMVEYESKIAGRKRAMRVYTPPGFSRSRKYPVLYLLHGANADEASWVQKGAADTILDNLVADQKAVPMIVVMPNGNWSSSRADSYGAPLVSDAFADELVDDIVPAVERLFPVRADRDHCALAGVSAGANQAINIWLSRPDTFAYLGVFIGGLESSTHAEREHRDALMNLGKKPNLKLLWITNGKNDVTYSRCCDTLELFDKYNIHYTYVEGQGFHGWDTARNDLYVFSPLLFRDAD